MSANGEVILFRSSGTNLVPGDENGIQDVFVSAPCPSFRRGDCNADGTFDISDTVFLLSALFSGGPAPACDDACDNNDDGQVDVADGIYGLGTLFSNGPPPADPFLDCGEDPTEDGLTCDTFPACP